MQGFLEFVGFFRLFCFILFFGLVFPTFAEPPDPKVSSNPLDRVFRDRVPGENPSEDSAKASAFSSGISLSENIFSSPLPDPQNPLYWEQISCDPQSCTHIPIESYEEQEEALDLVLNLMKKGAGKLLVEFSRERYKLQSEENKKWRRYLQEIAKRKNLVVFEPFYMSAKGIQIKDITLFSDTLQLAWKISERLRSYFCFSMMENYNAKVIYHPVTHEVMMIFFVHKDYGSICETVFSRCQWIEYTGDEIFDYQLRNVLERYPSEEILVRFDQKEAYLPAFSLEMEALLDTNPSGRLYRWLVAANSAEKKPTARERFLTFQTAIMILDYSLSAYDFVRSLQMYSVASDRKAIIYYEPDTSGERIRSVHFTRKQTSK